MNNLVSVIVASCNNEKYLQRCIESIFNQSYTNIEVIVVDDGSEDSSILLLEQLKKKYSFKLVKKENEGLSSSRQMGLDLASGKYVCFIDADDYIFSDYIVQMVDSIITQNTDICICGTEFRKQNNNVIYDLTTAFAYKNEIYNVTKEQLIKNYSKLLGKFTMSDSWNKMYKKEFIDNSGVKFELPKGLNGTDLAFNHKLLLHMPLMSTIDYRGYCHIMYEKSAVHRKHKNMESTAQIIISQLYEEICKLDMFYELQYQMRNVVYILYRNVFQEAYKDTDDRKISKEFRKISKNIKNVIKKFEIPKKILDIRPVMLLIFVILQKYNVFIILKLYFKMRIKKEH